MAVTGKRYFHLLDGFRGIAACLIVIGHTEFLFHPLHFTQGYLGVELFFVLSGVVVANAYEDRLNKGLSVRQFMWIRLVRLYPLYILGTAISYIAILFHLHDGWDNHHTYWLMVLSLFILPNTFLFLGRILYPLNFPAWSIFFELIVNYMYAAWLRLFTNRRLIYVMAMCACGLAVQNLSRYPFPYDANAHWDLYRFWAGGIWRSGYAFFCGILVYRLTQDDAVLRGPRAILAACGLLAAVLLLLICAPGERIVPIFDLVTATLFFPVIVYLAVHVEIGGPLKAVSRFAGLISYAIYAIHQPLGALIDKGLSARIDFGNYAPGIGFAFLAFLAAGCWLCDIYYDQLVRRWLLKHTPRFIK
jgi:peptidoglycan/LPS O-acetylase OafA/YrhL